MILADHQATVHGSFSYVLCLKRKKKVFKCIKRHFSGEVDMRNVRHQK